MVTWSGGQASSLLGLLGGFMLGILWLLGWLLGGYWVATGWLLGGLLGGY